MISDKNILTFLYILLFIFFLFVHLTANLKKKFFAYSYSTTLYKEELC